MSINTSLPGGGGGVGSNVQVTNVVGVTFPPTNSGGINPVGITGLVGITGAVGVTFLFPQVGISGFVGVTGSVGILGAIGVTFPFTTFGVTGFVGATIGNFPSGFGASITNQGFTVLNFPAVFGVTGALGVSVSNTGLGVTFPVLSVTFPIGFGVTFPTAGVTFPTGLGITFVQLSSQGITGGVGLTGLVLASLGYTLGKTNVFKFSQVTTGASASIFLATFMSAAGTNFYLMGYYFDGSYASATAGVGWIGTVGIQTQTGGAAATLMVHRVINPGAGIAQVNIEFIEPPFFGNSTIVAIGVIPSQTNLITWTGNFWGYQK